MNQIEDLNDFELLKEIGRRISFLRISAQLKQSDLAEKTGISRYALSRLENGVGGMRLESFLSILRSLHVLNRLSVVLPEPSLTPIQMLELEKRFQKMPKRVRSSSVKKVGRWGDEKSKA